MFTILDIPHDLRRVHVQALAVKPLAESLRVPGHEGAGGGGGGGETITGDAGESGGLELLTVRRLDRVRSPQLVYDPPQAPGLAHYGRRPGHGAWSPHCGLHHYPASRGTILPRHLTPRTIIIYHCYVYFYQTIS